MYRIDPQILMSIAQRLDSFRDLGPGWYDGKNGAPVPVSILEHIKEVVPYLMAGLGLEDLGFYPLLCETGRGGVQAEWDLVSPRTGLPWTVSIEWQEDGACVLHGCEVTPASTAFFELDTGWYDPTYLDQIILEFRVHLS